MFSRVLKDILIKISNFRFYCSYAAISYFCESTESTPEISFIPPGVFQATGAVAPGPVEPVPP